MLIQVLDNCKMTLFIFSKYNVILTYAYVNILLFRPSEPPAVPPHRDTTNSLKTRSMETSYNKNRRSSNFKSGSTDRRTLPTGMGSTSPLISLP